MNKRKKTAVIGGDVRQIYCAKRLCGDFDTALIGFDRELIPSFPQTASPPFDYAVLPVVPLDKNGFLSTPCTLEKITPDDVEKLLAPGAVIFAGRVDEKLRKAFPVHRLADYTEREEFALKNAVPSAEGAVMTALGELPVTLGGLKVLIVGMGRIGTALAEILKGFGSIITVLVRSEKGAATARLHGLRHVFTDELETDFQLVFNTAPELIFDAPLLKRFDRETLFIDLASKPGGIDFEAAAELGIKAIHALGLPGKTAPVTAGEIVAETVADMIGETEESNE